MRENRAGSAYQKRKTTRQNELDPGLESHSGCARGVGVTARNSSTRLQRSDVDRGASLRPGKPYASAYRRQVRNSSDWIAADARFCWTSCVIGVYVPALVPYAPRLFRKTEDGQVPACRRGVCSVSIDRPFLRTCCMQARPLSTRMKFLR